MIHYYSSFPVTELQIDYMTWAALKGKIIWLSVIIWVQGLVGPILSPFSPEEESNLWYPHYQAGLISVSEESWGDWLKWLWCQTWMITGKYGMPTLLPHLILSKLAHFPATFMGKSVWCSMLGSRSSVTAPVYAVLLHVNEWEDYKIKISHFKKSHSCISELTCGIGPLVWSSA